MDNREAPSANFSFDKHDLSRIVNKISRAGAEMSLENRGDYLPTFAVIRIPLNKIADLFPDAS